VNATDSRVLAGGAGLTHSSAMIFLRSTILYSFLLALLACGGNETNGRDAGGSDGDTTDGDNATDDGSDDRETTPTGTKDSGVKPSGTKDATVSPTPSPAKDGGSTPTPTVSEDGGTTARTDSGLDAGKDAGGGFMIPDIFGPPADAGSTPPKSDSGSSSGATDKSAPCKDLQLLCFDIFDMWLINPQDCATCNGGKGCQGCAIPYAY
jgi:hypothetical protein